MISLWIFHESTLPTMSPRQSEIIQSTHPAVLDLSSRSMHSSPSHMCLSCVHATNREWYLAVDPTRSFPKNIIPVQRFTRPRLPPTSRAMCSARRDINLPLYFGKCQGYKLATAIVVVNVRYQVSPRETKLTNLTRPAYISRARSFPRVHEATLLM